MRAVALVCLAVAAVAAPPIAAADPDDASVSPYFEVEGGDPRIESMPLEASRADVHIAGVIADVVVTQTYRNAGALPINARYVFPASTRAAVYGMTMTVGARVITAKIKEREEAKREYEEAERAGVTASLLEQDRPNVFSMRVANILPGERIAVELRYTELLVPSEGVYELVYPTVVGPRYASARVDGAAPHNQFVATPYQHKGVPAGYTFGLSVALAAGMPIQSLESPTHRINTVFAARREAATVALDAAEREGGNRDFVLRYRLAGADLSSGMLMFPGRPGVAGAHGEKFFVMMVQPPHRPPPELIPAREYVFVVDVSGSMRGFPLDTTKRLMRDLLSRLRPSDRFNVLLFSGASRLFANSSVAADKAQIDSALAFLGGEHGGGGTELRPALETALALPRSEAAVSRSFVVITDGYIAEEPAVFDHIRTHLDAANVFAFGIGSSVNRHLIDGIAKAGRGEPFVVLGHEHADATAAKLNAYIESPVLTGVKVAFDGFETYGVEPAVLPDVFADRPIIVYGKWRGEPKGVVTLTGVSGRGRFVNTIDVATIAPDVKHTALPYLWARHRLSELADFYGEDANREQIVDLGLRYNLLTKFTSFIAVHQAVRADGSAVDIDQPQPLPAGVEESAVEMAGGPEPELVILLAMILAAAGWQRWRARKLDGAAA